MKRNIVYALTKIRGIGTANTRKIIDYMQERSLTDLQQVDLSLFNVFRRPVFQFTSAFFCPDKLTDAMGEAPSIITRLF